jgi:CHAT domain-containing protein/Tfp pilus assembly protein PilF
VDNVYPVKADTSPKIILPGIVVEEAGTNYWEKPVLRRGDLLLSWSRGSAHGACEAPTFLWLLGIEQHPLGRVTVHGLRNGQPKDWTLSNADFVARTRPNFTGVWLRRYEQARQLFKTGEVSEASEQWLTLARSVPAEQAWLSIWLSYDAGGVLADHQLWKQADNAYTEAVREAGTDLDLLAPIQRSWGRSLSQRGQWVEAEEHYLKILQELQRAGKKLAAAEFLNTLADDAVRQGRFKQAREYHLAALSIEGQIAPKSDKTAWTLVGLGGDAFMSGDLDEADTRLMAALELFRNAGPRSAVAAALVVLANTAISRDDFVTAQQYLTEALAIETQTGNFLTDVHGSLAWLADKRGDFALATRFYKRQLEIERKQNHTGLNLAVGLINLGSVYRERGLLVRADRYVQQALQITRRLAPASEHTAAALGNLGEIAFARGRTREAETYLLQSMAIEEKLEGSSGWTGDVATRLERLGDIAQERRNLTQAERYYARAAEILVKVAPSGAHYAETLADLAHASRLEGNLEAARNHYEEALKALENQTARLGGSSEVRASFRAKHEKIYREYADVLLSLNHPELAFETVERSRARTLLEILAAAQADIRRGADPELIVKERSLQATLKAKSERRAHLLSDPHNEELKAVEKEISNLTSEYQDVEAQIRSNSPAYAALTQPQPLSLAEIQKRLLDPDTVLLEYSLGEECSHVFVVSSDSLHVEQLPRRSGVEAASRRVYDLLTARNRRQKKDESPAARMARIARADADYPAAAARLSRMVLEPVMKQIAGKRLLIVSDGALHYVSFAALPLSAPGTPSSPLAAEHEIVNLPSASVLAVLRGERMGREPAPRSVAVLADPVFDAGDARVKSSGGKSHIAGEAGRATARAAAAQAETAPAPVTREMNEPATKEESESSLALAHLTRSAADLGWRSRRRGEVYLPRLTFSRREADAIAAVTPPGQALEALDFQASRATALGGNLANYRMVHLATHALLNSKHPELSGLVFSLVDAQGRPQNGFLDLEDIYNMDLPAELVVLSACETGLGKEISGEGLVGLTRGFMYAGASRVMASLWKIDDRATAELMRHFYRAMLGQGMRPAAALRAAQLEMRTNKQWSSPYFWAAFQIQGEWK